MISFRNFIELTESFPLRGSDMIIDPTLSELRKFVNACRSTRFAISMKTQRMVVGLAHTYVHDTLIHKGLPDEAKERGTYRGYVAGYLFHSRERSEFGAMLWPAPQLDGGNDERDGNTIMHYPGMQIIRSLVGDNVFRDARIARGWTEEAKDTIG